MKGICHTLCGPTVYPCFFDNILRRGGQWLTNTKICIPAPSRLAFLKPHWPLNCLLLTCYLKLFLVMLLSTGIRYSGSLFYCPQYSVHAHPHVSPQLSANRWNMTVWLNSTATHTIHATSEKKWQQTTNKHWLPDLFSFFEWSLHHQLGCIILPSHIDLFFPVWHTTLTDHSPPLLFLFPPHSSSLHSSINAGDPQLCEH